MIKKANRSQSYLRMFIEGKAGDGKTLSALLILKGIQQYLSENKSIVDIGVIDTEYNRASVYANDDLQFYVSDIYDNNGMSDVVDGMKIHNRFSPLAIMQRIREFYKYPNIRLLSIDSISKSWEQVLQRTNEIESAEKRYNSFSVWAHPESKPLWNRLIEEIQSFHGHIITTIRLKNKYDLKKDGDKSRVISLGLDPIAQGETEYEGTLVLRAIEPTQFEVIKDNSGMGTTGNIIVPNEEFGYRIAEYLYSSGELSQPLTINSKELRQKRLLIEQNEEKIRENESFRSAFESIISLELYKTCTDEQLLDRAMKNVLKVKAKMDKKV